MSENCDIVLVGLSQASKCCIFGVFSLDQVQPGVASIWWVSPPNVLLQETGAESVWCWITETEKQMG